MAQKLTLIEYDADVYAGDDAEPDIQYRDGHPCVSGTIKIPDVQKPVDDAEIARRIEDMRDYAYVISSSSSSSSSSEGLVEELFEHHETGGDDSYTIGQTSYSVKLAQTFTPDIAHEISKVSLELFDGQGDGITGDIDVEIKATDANGLPTGDALTSGTIDAADLNPAHMSGIFDDEETFSFEARYCFSPNGLKFFTATLTASGVDVYGYDLTTAFDLNTASQASYYLAANCWARTINNIMFSADGTIMVINQIDAGWYGNINFRYTLSTAWDLSDVSASGVLYIHPDYISYGFYGSQFSSDGTKWFMTGTGGSTQKWLLQYNLSTPWDISTNSGSPAAQNIALASYTDSVGGCCFSEDGKKVAILDRTNKKILFWNLPTAWTLTSESKDSYEMDISSYCTAPLQICCSRDFKTFFVGDGGTIYKFEIPQIHGDWHECELTADCELDAATKYAVEASYADYEVDVSEPEWVNNSNGDDNYEAGSMLRYDGSNWYDS